MKRLLLLLVSASLLLTSCDDFGKKLSINEKSEVYYKGDGVSEADAKKLGDFLLEKGYFTTTDTRSVQLLKENDAYTVKFVVDEEKLNKDKENVLMGFKVWQMWIQDNVFAGAKTRLVLADDKLKDVQEVGEFTAAEKAQLNAPEQTTSDAATSDATQAPTDGTATDDDATTADTTEQ